MNYMSSGTWGNWVRVRRNIRGPSPEGRAICFVGDEKDYIVVLWDGADVPELIPADKLLHWGYWMPRKMWKPFGE